MPTGFIAGPADWVEGQITAKKKFDAAMARAEKQAGAGGTVCIESDSTGVRVQGYLEVSYTQVPSQKLLPSG